MSQQASVPVPVLPDQLMAGDDDLQSYAANVHSQHDMSMLQRRQPSRMHLNRGSKKRKRGGGVSSVALPVCHESTLVEAESCIAQLTEQVAFLRRAWRNLYYPASRESEHALDMGLLISHDGHPLRPRAVESVRAYTKLCQDTANHLTFAIGAFNQYMEEIDAVIEESGGIIDETLMATGQSSRAPQRRQRTLLQKLSILQMYRELIRQEYERDEPSELGISRVVEYKNAHRDVIRHLIGDHFSELQLKDKDKLDRHCQRIDDKISQLRKLPKLKNKFREYPSSRQAAAQQSLNDEVPSPSQATVIASQHRKGSKQIGNKRQRQ
eukprot:TRINITY_DN60572_c0_g1_i1.p1 TRINITY_DN60572_c0_g1~~TRINITY_DN60572_c0_g1_i1.p1  ORF type:complete len:324 (+),score=198.87 TRINITY_DN60572_c0_g1_i1:95-1066(+)